MVEIPEESNVEVAVIEKEVLEESNVVAAAEIERGWAEGQDVFEGGVLEDSPAFDLLAKVSIEAAPEEEVGWEEGVHI